MKAETIEFFDYMLASGIPYKTIPDGEDVGVWIALAPALRKCGYRKPTEIDGDPFEAVAIRKMLIGGKVQAAISLLEFSTAFAPFCTAQVVQDFGVASVNGLAISRYQTGRLSTAPAPTDPTAVMADLEAREWLIGQANLEIPGSGNLFSLPSTRLVGLGEGRTAIITGDLNFDDDESTTRSFLMVHPEWEMDVSTDDKGNVVYTLACALALSKFLARLGIGDMDKIGEFQHAVTEMIIDSGGDFRPMSKRP